MFRIKKILRKTCAFGLIVLTTMGISSSHMSISAEQVLGSLGLDLIVKPKVIYTGEPISLINTSDKDGYDHGIKVTEGTNTLTAGTGDNAGKAVNGQGDAYSGIALYLRTQRQGSEDTGSYTWTKVWENGAPTTTTIPAVKKFTPSENFAVGKGVLGTVYVEEGDAILGTTTNGSTFATLTSKGGDKGYTDASGPNNGIPNGASLVVKVGTTGDNASDGVTIGTAFFDNNQNSMVFESVDVDAVQEYVNGDESITSTTTENGYSICSVALGDITEYTAPSTIYDIEKITGLEKGTYNFYYLFALIDIVEPD